MWPYVFQAGTTRTNRSILVIVLRRINLGRPVSSAEIIRLINGITFARTTNYQQTYSSSHPPLSLAIK